MLPPPHIVMTPKSGGFWTQIFFGRFGYKPGLGSETDQTDCSHKPLVGGRGMLGVVGSGPISLRRHPLAGFWMLCASACFQLSACQRSEIVQLGMWPFMSFDFLGFLACSF